MFTYKYLGKSLNLFKKRSVAKKLERRTLSSKFLRKSTLVSFKSKFCKASLNKRRDSLFRVKNVCVATHRKRAVLAKYKVSRIILKQLSNYGYVSGMRKHSK